MDPQCLKLPKISCDKNFLNNICNNGDKIGEMSQVLLDRYLREHQFRHILHKQQQHPPHHKKIKEGRILINIKGDDK